MIPGVLASMMGQRGAVTPPIECPATLAPPANNASYICVMDAEHGCILYEKAADTSVGLASIAKLMTAILVMRIKGGSLTEVFTVASADTNTSLVGSNVGLQTNDQLTIQDLLKCMLIRSGGDAAACLARSIGDYLYAQAGNTGSQGEARFVEEMNAVAAELGMTNSTFVNPHGGRTTEDNTSTARDAAKMAAEAYSYALIRTISGTTSDTATVTGPNARTINLSPHSVGLVNNGEPGVKAGKDGEGPFTGYSACLLWQSEGPPAGARVVSITLHSAEWTSGDLDRAPERAQSEEDARNAILQLPDDFPYLDPSGAFAQAPDASFANVLVLVRGDGSIVDESTYARTLTAQGDAGLSGNPRLTGSHSLIFDGSGDYIESPNAAELRMGSDDFCVEVLLAVSGAPSGIRDFVSVYNTSGNQRCWTLRWDSSVSSIRGLCSTNGSGFVEARYFLGSGSAFFNGQIRHVAMVRNGSELSVWADGVKGGTTANLSTNALFASTAKLVIGARQDGTGIADPYAGLLEVRVTRGVPRYTAAFSPRRRRFPLGA